MKWFAIGLWWTCLAGLACGTPRQPAVSALAWPGPDGRLLYGYYANEGETNPANRLPDFSHAGYEGGGVPIPEVPVVLTLLPREGDDTDRIQRAINQVSEMPRDENGFRGAVLLKAGHYHLSDTLRMTADGVVLRGEGQDVLGTVIEATRPENHTVIFLGLDTSGYHQVPGTLQRITTPYVPVGSTGFRIQDSTGFQVGDRIGIRYTRNDFWLEDLDVVEAGWTTTFYSLTHERRITGIQGNTLTIDIPLVDVIQDRYGGGEVFQLLPTARVVRSGVEHLRLVSGYAHDTDEEHPWRAVTLQNAENCWVRGVTAVHFAYSAVLVNAFSRNITVEDCAFLDPKSEIDGGRRYSFVLQGASTSVLFQRCFSDRGRHDFVTNSRVRGPNVFVDGYAQQSFYDSGPHHRWAAGNLFDNIFTSHSLAVEKRSTSGHAWSGTQTIFWNCEASRQRLQSPRGGMNFAIGSKAERRPGIWHPDEAEGWWEHQWENVAPRSLYYQQLSDRLGEEALHLVTHPNQRKDMGIHAELREWAGRYFFQPPPLVSERPSLRWEKGQAVLEIHPFPETVVRSIQWYEIVGDGYEPAPSTAETMVVSRPSAANPRRLFFCRVVTDKGPYWTRAVRLFAHGIREAPLAANGYVIGMRAEEGKAPGYYEGGSNANAIGSTGGASSRTHFNPIPSFELPSLEGTGMALAVLSFNRHREGDNQAPPHADLYGLDPRKEGFALDENLWHQGPPDRRPFITFYQPAVVSREDPTGHRYEVDVTHFIRSFYHGTEPLVDRVYFRLSHGMTLAPATLRRLAIFNQTRPGTGAWPTMENQFPQLLLVSEPLPGYAAWALQNGLEGFDFLPEADPDGDGQNNLVEYLFGTHPKKADNRMKVILSQTTLSDSTPAVAITFATLPGRVYDILKRGKAGGGQDWIPLASQLEGTGGKITHFDPIHDPRALYKVRVSLSN